MSEIMAQAVEKLTTQYVNAQDAAQEEVDLIKSYYRLQDADGYRTKADVLTTIRIELPRVAGRVVLLVEEELVAEL